MSRYQVADRQPARHVGEANSAVHFTQQFTTFILAFALIALVVACSSSTTPSPSSSPSAPGRWPCSGASAPAAARCSAAPAGVGDHRPGLVAAAWWPGSASAGGWSGCSPRSARPRPGRSSRPSAVVIAMSAGSIVTVAAAVLPARSATRVAPVAALGGQHQQPGSRRAWSRVAVSVVFAGRDPGHRHRPEARQRDVRLRRDRRGRWPVLRGRARARAADRAARHRVPRLAPRPATGPVGVWPPPTRGATRTGWPPPRPR